MEKQLGYQDIALKPQKCIVDSRKQCDTTIQWGKHKYAN